jgi:hypothetical protein
MIVSLIKFFPASLGCRFRLLTNKESPAGAVAPAVGVTFLFAKKEK